MELIHTQVVSFVTWFCDTYTINRVLDVYVNHAEKCLLDGKSYEDLKSVWQAYQISKSEGIVFQGQPIFFKGEIRLLV